MEPLEVEGGKGIVQLDPTGVIRLSWASAVRIEEADARAAMAAVNEVANGGEYPHAGGYGQHLIGEPEGAGCLLHPLCSVPDCAPWCQPC